MKAAESRLRIQRDIDEDEGTDLQDEPQMLSE